MHKEFLEIVGNGSSTGSVLEETIVVSVTISISVQNRHSRILLRALPRGRMREMRREPEVPEARVPVVECLDGPERITLKELAPIHSVKSGILQNACSTRPRVVADLGKSALYVAVIFCSRIFLRELIFLGLSMMKSSSSSRARPRSPGVRLPGDLAPGFCQLASRDMLWTTLVSRQPSSETTNTTTTKQQHNNNTQQHNKNNTTKKNTTTNNQQPRSHFGSSI